MPFENLTTTSTNPTTFYSAATGNFVPEVCMVLECLNKNYEKEKIRE
jgi:hypothetical protein